MKFGYQNLTVNALLYLNITGQKVLKNLFLSFKTEKKKSPNASVEMNIVQVKMPG